jgi:hypothetical protein
LISRRRIASLGLSAALLSITPPARAQESGPQPRPTPAPRSRRPVSDSVDRNVEKVLRAHEEPCERAFRLKVPCYPMEVAAEGPRFSVADAMRRYRVRDRRPAPGPPTNSELLGELSGAPQSASGGVGFDPVCTVKSLVRRVSGGSTFYLYRIRDQHGEQRPLLTDRKLDAVVRAGVQYEYMGEYKGECEAIAAWRAALREDVAPPPAELGVEVTPAPANAPPP